MQGSGIAERAEYLKTIEKVKHVRQKYRNEYYAAAIEEIEELCNKNDMFGYYQKIAAILTPQLVGMEKIRFTRWYF